MGLEVEGVNKKRRKTKVIKDESDQTITYIGKSSVKTAGGWGKQHTNKF